VKSRCCFTPSQPVARHCRAGTDEDRVFTFTVADTGIGMEPALIAKAMEPFQQVDGSMTRRYEGTGLGLPIAKSLAELHGGRLMIESAPGRGTSVTVRLPSARVIGAAPISFAI
jgi:signal transduction histidine kinase